MNRRRGCSDRGAVDALGLVVMTAPMIALVILVFSLGRDVDVRAQMRAAAESAAQAAALERNATAAESAALTAATAMLDDDCSDPGVNVVYPPDPQPNSASLVQVTVSCTLTSKGFEDFQAADRIDTVRAFAPLDFFRAASG